MAAPELLESFLRNNRIAFTSNVGLAEYSSFRIGGPAAFFIEPKSADELAALQRLVREHAIPTFLLGGGSNLLIADSGFDGLVIHPQLGEEPQIIEQSEEQVVFFVPASARAPLTGKRISALGYAGLEFLTTIPGQFGGSIIQNAGCYGFELKDSIVEVEIVRDGVVERLKNEQCDFAYRDSVFKRDESIWVTGATLRLGKGVIEAIDARILDFKNRRIHSQPKNRRSAGSIFKNPRPEVSALKAWQLIEAAGLRGTVQGEAEISSEHCNFIVNQSGRARAADVYALIRLIEERVLATSGVRLEREVVLVGDFV